MPNNRSPLWKQVLGAAVGGSLALMIYAGYQMTSTQLSSLTGILVLPQDRINADTTQDVRIADASLDEEQVKRITSRAQRIAADFSKGAAGTTPEAEIVEIVPITLPQEQEIIEAWENVDTDVPAWDEEQIEFPEDPAFYGNTDELPDSGIGMWLATLVAFAGATIYLYRKKVIACAAKA